MRRQGRAVVEHGVTWSRRRLSALDSASFPTYSTVGVSRQFGAFMSARVHS
jgi:hypothetical protein